MSEPERAIRTTVAVIGDDALAGVLRAAPDVDVVAQVSERDALWDALWRCVPDAVVIDTRAAWIEPVTTCRELSEMLPVCRILLVAADGVATFDAVVAGAMAVVDPTTLAGAPGAIVQRVARSEAIVPQAWAAEALRAYEEEGAPHLTATEREVLQRLAKGATSEAIAGLHEVPPRLVRLHAGFALTKLHRADRDRRTGVEG